MASKRNSVYMGNSDKNKPATQENSSQIQVICKDTGTQSVDIKES